MLANSSSLFTPGDGLRADKAFQSFPDPFPNAGNSSDALAPRPLAPFIRSRVLEHGTFGVSHTRVPTESRPGHVALIAGLYEDVSAVTTGWKLNPVNFDSVFNRSRHTWSWGSPDILPMFKEGAVPGRVDADAYPHEFEDFSADATALDIYVFDHVKQMFEEAKVNKTLDAELRKDKNIFFLHLLGLDTAGHAYRPYSKEYLHNIQVVDKGVQEVAELIGEFYNDDKTAFVFTADHGMSDWGSHGDGHPDNTRTPVVAWGAGVAKPVTNRSGKAPGHEDGFSYDWGFDHIKRNDVSQADVATLMAYLVGTDYPVNSVGELPLPFLAASPAEKVDALVTNAKEVLEMYRIKEEQKLATEIRYKPFAPLGDLEHSPAHRIAEIENLSASGKHDEAIEKCTELIKLAINGLRYLQTYDWLFLRTLVTIGYLGWMGYALATAVDLHILHGSVQPSRTMASNLAFSSVLVVLYSVLFVQRSSWTYYGYAIFPVVFWEEIWAKREAVGQGSNILFGHMKTTTDYLVLAIKVIAFLALLEGLVSRASCHIFQSLRSAIGTKLSPP
jgi:phosphatidylinositol glycan class N